MSVSSSGVQAQPSIAAEASPRAEPRRQQLMRHAYRVRLYTWAVLSIAALVVLIVLIAANVRSVKLDWVIGSTHASLVWIILAATVLGWLLGVATSVLFRFRARSRVAQ
jgi:uncharacterized integral membrane protein